MTLELAQIGGMGSPGIEPGQVPVIMELRRSVTTGRPVPVLPSWLTDPLWDQFAALLPKHPTIDPSHPLGCHRRRIGDRIVFDKLLQLLRFGCSYQAISHDLLGDHHPQPPR
jgi:hypothetical protein